MDQVESWRIKKTKNYLRYVYLYTYIHTWNSINSLEKFFSIDSPAYNLFSHSNQSEALFATPFLILINRHVGGYIYRRVLSIQSSRITYSRTYTHTCDVYSYYRYSAFIVLIPIGVGGELLGQYIVQSLYANKWNYSIPQFNLTVGYRHLIILMMLSSAQGKSRIPKCVISSAKNRILR